MLTPPEPAVSAPVGGPVAEEAAAEMLRQAKRVRRLKMHALAWALGATIVTAAWIAHEWNANGAFERFAHEGNRGDWNPTLWALVVLLWGLTIGIMALRVRFERPPSAAEIDRETRRTEPHVRARARIQLERRGQLKFHMAAWLLGMVLLVPMNALIEWQDNGGFERISRNSQPGSWDPWILYVGGIWALVVAIVIALPLYLEDRKREARMERFSGKYLSLTSFKRDGTGVATPVWFVGDNGHLLVETDADSYKVKRIRRDAHVQLAVCDARGRVHGEPIEADARILPENERERVERLLAQKYRIDRYTVLPIYHLVMRLRGRSSRSHEPPVALEITPR
jgi:PPOX class probable F420-dependent enzyme